MKTLLWASRWIETLNYCNVLAVYLRRKTFSGFTGMNFFTPVVGTSPTHNLPLFCLALPSSASHFLEKKLHWSGAIRLFLRRPPAWIWCGSAHVVMGVRFNGCLRVKYPYHTTSRLLALESVSLSLFFFLHLSFSLSASLAEALSVPRFQSPFSPRTAWICSALTFTVAAAAV